MTVVTNQGDRATGRDRNPRPGTPAGRSTESITLIFACLVQWPLALLVADGSFSKFDCLVGLLLVAAILLWLGDQKRRWRFGGPGWSALLVTAGAFLAMRDASFTLYLAVVVITWALTSMISFASQRPLLAKISALLTVVAAGILLVEYFGIPKAGKPDPKVVDTRKGSFTIRDTAAYKTLRPSASAQHRLVDDQGNEIFDVEYHIDDAGSRRVPGRPMTGPRWMLFGGSHAFGNGLTDRETIAGRLQQTNPDVRVYNFGVPWCGTADAYFHMKSKVESETPPNKSFYLFIEGHIMRTAAPDWFVTRYGHYERPCFELNPDLVYVGSAARRAENYPLWRRLNYNLLMRSKIYRATTTTSYNPSADDVRRVVALAAAMRGLTADRNEGDFLFVIIPQNGRADADSELVEPLKRQLQASDVPVLDCRERMYRRWKEAAENPDDYFIRLDGHPSGKYAQFVAECIDQALRRAPEEAGRSDDSGVGDIHPE